MSAMPFSFPIFKAFTTTGTLGPLAGGLLHTFEAGTSTPLAVYQDAALTVPHTNPVVLDSNGQATIYLGANSYKMRLEDSTGAVQPGWPIDYIEDALDNAKDYTDTLRADLAADDGSSLVGFLQSGVGAVARTVQDKGRESISVWDYMSAAQKADVIAGTLLVDTSDAWQKALDAADGRWIDANDGDFLISNTVTSYNITGTVHPGVRIRGNGANKTRIFNRVASGPCFDFDHRIGSTTYANQVFSTGSTISNIGIFGDSGTADSVGLKIEGLYAFRLDQCIIRDHTSYGVHVDFDASYNPDISASVRIMLLGCTISYNKIGFYAPGNQACPTLTAIGCNFDWNTDLGILHSSNYFKVINGSVSFNGYDYAGDYTPSDAFGGYLITNNVSGVAAGCMLDNVELDGNRPQQVVIGAASNFTLTRCKFGVRLTGAETNKYMAVFGFDAPAGSFSCYDFVFEHNSITVNAGDYSGVGTFVYVKSRAGCRQGRIGPNMYFVTGTGLTIGTNAFYIVEDARTGGNSGAVNALRYEAQNAYIGMTGYNVQYRSGFSVSIPDDGVVSFKPPLNTGILMLSGGSSFTHGIIGYVASTGVTWAMATLSTGVNVGPTNTVLTGTTGTDGRLTVGAAAGTMYIENRLGSATTISLKTIIGNEFGVD